MLDYRSKGRRFDPRPGHGDFLRVRDKWRPTEITHTCIRTPLVSFQGILVLLRILGRIQYGGRACHKEQVRYIIHLYCLAVQAGFYSDVEECSNIDRRVPGSILGWGMEIFFKSP